MTTQIGLPLLRNPLPASIAFCIRSVTVAADRSSLTDVCENHQHDSPSGLDTAPQNLPRVYLESVVARLLSDDMCQSRLPKSRRSAQQQNLRNT
jgi:hypothetical protein